MNKTNRRGPKIEPWGSPCGIIDVIDSLSLMDTN